MFISFCGVDENEIEIKSNQALSPYANKLIFLFCLM